LGKWIVCAAWPYVNSVPHLGTFIHLLSADIFKRYLHLKGEEAISVTGSDEHGTPIEVEAIKSGIPPKQLTDKYHKEIVDLLGKYRINFNNYTRTENKTHIDFTQTFYKRIYDNGYIFTEQVELPYCQKCDRFLPDRFIEGTCNYCDSNKARGDQCDACGRILDPLEVKDPKCAFCKTKPIIKKSTHWFFNLPKLSDKLKSFLDSNKQMPDNAKNFSYKWLEEGLRSRALTRDNKWGIPSPFPKSEGKTIYVWLEALLGYVSATKEWAEKQGKPQLWKDFWFDSETRSIFFIGKDNIPFHTIILPALLMASEEGYILPWQVSSTEFILYESHGKFSKSRRIGVWMDEALEIAEPEYWRFVLALIRPETKDANFTWEEFERRINNDLNDAIGNFIHRTLAFIYSHFNGVIPTPSKLKDRDRLFQEEIINSSKTVGDLFDKIRIRDALNAIIDLARLGNQYFSDKEPWHKMDEDVEDASTTLYIATQLVYSLSILLQPFLPFIAEKIWKQLNIPGEDVSQRWEMASEFNVKSGHRIGQIKPLFHKVNASEIKENRKIT
jgi:methionyl-tRNA synthetase